MRCHLLRDFELSTDAHVLGDPGCTELVISDSSQDPAGEGASPCPKLLNIGDNVNRLYVDQLIESLGH
jgi:hypothetical protein